MNANRTALSAEVTELLQQLELKGGHLALSRETFLAWRKRLRETTPARRPQLKVELIAAARRMYQHGVDGAVDAIAQLVALAREVSRVPQRRGWGPVAR